MTSSATNIRSSWSDPFHRSLCLRRKLEWRYNEHLCLPQLQRSRDRMSAVHINYNKKSGIDASSRLFNNAQEPPSSMLDPSLLSLGHDGTFPFGLDLDDTAAPMEKYDFIDGFSDHAGHPSPAVSLISSTVLSILDPLVVDLSGQASGQALSLGNAQPKAPLAPETVQLSAPAVVQNVALTSAQQQLSTTGCFLTPASTPTPTDTLDACSSLSPAKKVVTDAAQESAPITTAVNCKLLRG